VNKKTVGLAFALAVACAPCAAADPLAVGNGGHYRLGGHLSMLLDPSRSMSLDDVIAEETGWRETPADEPNPGFSAAFCWVRFTLESRTDDRLLLVYRYANVDNVSVFTIHADGRRSRLDSGNHIPFADRSMPHRYPVFPIEVSRGETVLCYVQVRNEQGAVFPLSIWSESAFRESDRQEQIVTGFFLGLFLVVILFNILFFLATGDATYLSYILMVVFYLLFEVAYRGIGGEYLWPRVSWIDDQVLVVSAAACMTMGIVFTRGFLQTKAWAKGIHGYLGVILCVAAADAVCSLIMPFRIMVQITNALLLVVAFSFVPAGVVVLLRGFRAARFYLAAWVLMVAGGFIFGMLNLGIVPSTVFTANAMTFGVSVQVILLSFAVMDRILLLRRDRETMQRERLEAVEKSLYKDGLTGMPNRNRLMADLVPGREMTAVIVNIDQFKAINDYFGQKAGDYAIVELGGRVSGVMSRYGGCVYRLHADEFAAIIPRSCAEDEMKVLGAELAGECQDTPYLFEKETLRLDVSIGIAVSDSRHLEKADMALTVSRARKGFVIYTPELEVIKKYADNLHWLHVIRESIEQDRIVPYFQPIMNNASGDIDKYESLMRIRTENGAIIGPGAFLTIAKKSRIYPELSRLIVGKTACLMRGTDAEVSINVSMEDIMHPDVLRTIDEAVSEPQIARRIVFELLESEGIENYDEVSSFISRMKTRGCKIAIDDFGTGYSNFSHILRLHVDYLKLDSSLIKHIAEDASARCIVETIVSFASRLGIQTIAEFVHNGVVQNVVREIGIDFSQGYFIGEPMPSMRDAQ
jgi:diguanylate cyclase (GGDEF)-like protein